jgi:hypothetical protein
MLNDRQHPPVQSKPIQGTDLVRYMWMDGQNPHIFHWCKLRGFWVCTSTGHHTLVSADPLTLDPSLHMTNCAEDGQSGCNLHGFIKSRKWVSA